MSKEELLKNGYKAYENDEICVFWNPELCEHATECIRANSKVFDVSQAPASEIAEIIDKCPSEALKYELKSKE